jgi:hypothetical protein
MRGDKNEQESFFPFFLAGKTYASHVKRRASGPTINI